MLATFLFSVFSFVASVSLSTMPGTGDSSGAHSYFLPGLFGAVRCGSFTVVGAPWCRVLLCCGDVLAPFRIINFYSYGVATPVVQRVSGASYEWDP